MDESPRTIEGPVPCIRCGYDLRGVAVNGTCPECGATAVESLAASRSITKREVAELFCRILAVWMGFYGGIQLVQNAIHFIFNPTINIGASLLIRIWVGVTAYPLVGALLWWMSPWIARHTISQDGPAIPSATWTGRDLMAVAVCLLGLYLIATGAEQLIGNFFGETIVSMAGYNPSGSVKISSTVRLLAGLFMIIGRKRLARWLHKVRTAGRPQG
ncbi:MAG: hypothetical protein IT445_15860 [Phycisphaeraceae bacterium]|nr:hypothetical protein [Phycisphaeraceae bacterium]